MDENGFTSRAQQQVTDIFLTQGNQQRNFLKTLPTLKILWTRMCGQEWPYKTFFADFPFYLAPNHFFYSASYGISFITCLSIMFISVYFSSWFLDFSKNCTGNFRKIAFSSKLNLGVLPWSLRKNVSIL